MEKEVTKEVQSLVETELRKGASNSRIANLLGMPYEEAVKLIEEIKESFRPTSETRLLFLSEERRCPAQLKNCSQTVRWFKSIGMNPRRKCLIWLKKNNC